MNYHIHIFIHKPTPLCVYVFVWCTASIMVASLCAYGILWNTYTTVATVQFPVEPLADWWS